MTADSMVKTRWVYAFGAGAADGVLGGGALGRFFCQLGICAGGVAGFVPGFGAAAVGVAGAEPWAHAGASIDPRPTTIAMAVSARRRALVEVIVT